MHTDIITGGVSFISKDMRTNANITQRAMVRFSPGDELVMVRFSPGDDSNEDNESNTTSPPSFINTEESNKFESCGNKILVEDIGNKMDTSSTI